MIAFQYITAFFIEIFKEGKDKNKSGTRKMKFEHLLFQ